MVSFLSLPRISRLTWTIFCCKYQNSFQISFFPKLLSFSCVVFLSKEFTYTTLEARYLQNASQTAASSFNRATAIIGIILTWPLSVRFHRVVHLKSFRIRSLLSCCVVRLATALRRCMSWPKCAPFAWVLWKAGAPNTIDRMLLRHHVGLKSTSMVLFNGWIEFLHKWALHAIQFHLFLDCSPV